MTNTWIVTTGSSDILIETQNIHKRYFNEVQNKLKGNCPKTPSEKDKYFALESRPMGRIYGRNLESSNNQEELEKKEKKFKEKFKNLIFPLWDSFLSQFQSNNSIKLDRIIVFLSDQEHIFMPAKRDKKSPFWKDTIESKELFEWYLNSHDWTKDINVEFLVLDPNDEQLNPENKGLDDWDTVLKLMEKTFAEDIKIECREGDTIYVSHQAGTPAMSSALQFVSLAKFGSAVKFLVANEYDTEATNILPSSRYLRALQLQKAKQLIEKGIPGAALELIKDVEPAIALDLRVELQKYVLLFNIQSVFFFEGIKIKEFKPINAGERIRRSLDLVEFFFEQENYLAGITLLIAAQETFLKAAILTLVKKIDDRFSNFLKWNERGFSIESKEMLTRISDTDVRKSTLNFCAIVSFSELNVKEYIKLGNSQMLEWLKSLIETNSKSNNWSWKLLDWSCFYYKEHELDCRNQLVHNLRGIDKIDALCYLKSYKERDKEETKKEHKEMRKKWEALSKIPTVKEFYRDTIKKPFVRILCDVGLCKDDDTNILAEELKKLSDRIQ